MLVICSLRGFHAWSGIWGLTLLLLLPATSRAITLDWSSASISWTVGSLTASFDVDPNNAGNDVTITISGDTSYFQSGYPAIDTTAYTSQQLLTLYVNSFTSANQTVTVSVQFNYADGVSNVTTTLYDVDEGTANNKGKNATYTFDDQINQIYGTTTNGSLVGATVTGAADNTVTGSGTTNATVYGTASNGSTSTNANVGINFGTNVITGFTFTYGNNTTNAQSDPDLQYIGLGNIDFTPKKKLPERGTFLALAVTGLSCGLMRWRARPKK